MRDQEERLDSDSSTMLCRSDVSLFGQVMLRRLDVSDVGRFVTGDASRSPKEGCRPANAGACINVCEHWLDAVSAAFALSLRIAYLTPFS